MFIHQFSSGAFPQSTAISFRVPKLFNQLKKNSKKKKNLSIIDLFQGTMTSTITCEWLKPKLFSMTVSFMLSSPI